MCVYAQMDIFNYSHCCFLLFFPFLFIPFLSLIFHLSFNWWLSNMILVRTFLFSLFFFLLVLLLLFFTSSETYTYQVLARRTRNKKSSFSYTRNTRQNNMKEIFVIIVKCVNNDAHCYTVQSKLTIFSLLLPHIHTYVHTCCSKFVSCIRWSKSSSCTCFELWT